MDSFTSTDMRYKLNMPLKINIKIEHLKGKIGEGIKTSCNNACVGLEIMK